MGAPRKVEVKGFKHTAHTQPAAAAAAVDPAGSAGDAGTEQAPEATGESFGADRARSGSDTPGRPLHFMR
jgi:hypothetical protein